MAKRHSDALAINEGACNPSGIAHAIIDACREARAEPNHQGTDQLRADPALQLMVFQLAFLCGLHVEFPGPTMDGYLAAVKACEEAAKAPVPAAS